MRNYDYQLINRCSFKNLAELLNIAKEKEKEKCLRDEYNSIYPLMLMKIIKHVSFKEYYDMCTMANIDMRPADEILNEIEEAEKKFKGGS